MRTVVYGATELNHVRKVHFPRSPPRPPFILTDALVLVQSA